MLSLRSMMALLAVLALSAQAAESAIAAPKFCAATDVGKGFCLNCITKAKCVTAGAPPESRGNCLTPPEKCCQACTVLADVATCKPIIETACKCNMTQQCDPYDPNSLLICLKNSTVSTDCSANGKTCVNGDCVELASTTTTASPSTLCKNDYNGYVLMQPECTRAVYCIGGKYSDMSADCHPAGYFDIDNKNCTPFPTKPCPDFVFGANPDQFECSKWYICKNGEVLSEETCPTEIPDFDINSKDCVKAGTGACTTNDNCTYSFTSSAPTTTTPVSGSTTTTISSSATTPVSSSTTTPISSSTTTTISSSTTTPVSSSTTTPVSSSTTTTISSSTTTPVSSSTTTPVSSSTTTTSRPATCTAANVGQRYPYAGNCKKYWSCRQVASGVYEYVGSTCINDLVFNAATTYCDTLANVPSCVIGK